MEYESIVKNLSQQRGRIAGLKQVLRALEGGKAAVVILADDADDHIRRKVKAQCAAHGVPCVEGPLMAELGAACKLQVGTAVACMIKDIQSPKGCGDL